MRSRERPSQNGPCYLLLCFGNIAAPVSEIVVFDESEACDFAIDEDETGVGGGLSPEDKSIVKKRV